MPVVALALLLTACGGKKEGELQSAEAEVAASEPSASELSAPSEITDIDGCPFGEEEALGYWRMGLGDSLVFIIYQKGSRYYDVGYNVVTRQFHKPHPLAKGTAQGLSLYKCAEEECFYEIQESDGRLAIRALDVMFVIDRLWKVEFTGKAPAAPSQTFVLDKGKLGPVAIGKAYTDLPQSVEGLYDSFKYKSKTRADMDGEWTEEYVMFYRKGKEIFSTGVDDKKITSITLLKNATNIKTADGYCIGYNARKLFQEKKMDWETYYMGEVFASKDGYTYFVNDDGVTTDVPEKASDFKDGATLSKIVYM